MRFVDGQVDRIAHRAARGFDMEIGYHNRTAVAGSSYRYFDSLIELATWADFLIVAAPGGAGTRHLINADVLTALGPKGYLVNIGRGTVVDTAALIDALQSNRIAGVGLDVVEGEPNTYTLRSRNNHNPPEIEIVRRQRRGR